MNHPEQRDKRTQDTMAMDEARRVISHVKELKASAPVAWLFDNLKTRADKMADQILHNNEMTPEQREAMRRERLGLLEALRAPADAEASQKAVLASLEINPRPSGEKELPR